MAFSEKITLCTVKEGLGASDPEVLDSTEVWANVADIGVTVKYAAEAAGISAELQAVMYRREYKGQTHARYRGVLYQISSTGRAANDLHIKLILTRG